MDSNLIHFSNGSNLSTGMLGLGLEVCSLGLGLVLLTLALWSCHKYLHFCISNNICIIFPDITDTSSCFSTVQNLAPLSRTSLHSVHLFALLCIEIRASFVLLWQQRAPGMDWRLMSARQITESRPLTVNCRIGLFGLNGIYQLRGWRPFSRKLKTGEFFFVKQAAWLPLQPILTSMNVEAAVAWL